MVCGMVLEVDFTAPACLACLFLLLPSDAVWLTLSACIIHETAHLFMTAALHHPPKLLRLSAVGMRLVIGDLAVCPADHQAAIWLSGAAANLLMAAMLWRLGHVTAAGVQLAMGLFNLLPYRAADGGSLIDALWQGSAWGIRHPNLRRWACLPLTVGLLYCLWRGQIQNVSLWGMLALLQLSELWDIG